MSQRNKEFGVAPKMQLLWLATWNWRFTGRWWNRNFATDLCLLLSTPVLLTSSGGQCFSYPALLSDPFAQGDGAFVLSSICSPACPTPEITLKTDCIAMTWGLMLTQGIDKIPACTAGGWDLGKKSCCSWGFFILVCCTGQLFCHYWQS